jgi:hypothetical protein
MNLNSRRKVLTAVAATERKLLAQQAKVERHEHYWLRFFRENRAFLVIAISLPILAAGFKAGGASRVLHLFSQLSRVVIVAIVTSAKTRLIQTITRKTLH